MSVKEGKYFTMLTVRHFRLCFECSTFFLAACFLLLIVEKYRLSSLKENFNLYCRTTYALTITETVSDDEGHVTQLRVTLGRRYLSILEGSE